jgi:hypothetical protein
VAVADAEDDEDALADAELLLVGEVGIVDDGGDDVLGDDVGLGVLLGLGRAVVPGTVDGCSTVLVLGSAVTG